MSADPYTVIPDSVRPRLSRIVRSLASDHPSEVVAAAAALKRALAACGADLNDLGDAIERPAGDKPIPHQDRASRPDYVVLDLSQRVAVLIALRRGLESPRLSRWEADFTKSILERLEDSRARLSRRQAEAVDRVLTKLAGAHR